MRKKRFVVKQRGKAAIRIAMLAGALLIVIGLVYGAVVLIKGARRTKSSLVSLPFAVGANYTYTGSGFLYFANGKLCYDDIADNKKDTSYRINTEELKLTASSTISVLYHDTAVQIVGSNDSLVFSGKVLDVICGNSHIAVLREDSAGNTAIVIYDAAGIQTDQMDFDTTDLIDFGFSNTSDETLWTLELDFSCALPVSTLTTYNLSTKRTTGVMSVQSQLVSDVLFTNSSVFLSSTTHLIRFNLAGSSEAYRMTVYGWELMDFSFTGSAPLLLYKERDAAHPDSLKLYTVPEGDVGSASISCVHPPENTLGAFLSYGKLLVYTNDSLYTYSADGKLLSTAELASPIEAATKLSDAHMLLQSGNAMYLSIIK